MKKFIIIITLSLFFTAGGLYAKTITGIGLYGNFLGGGNGGLGTSVGLTLRLSSFPVLGLEWYFGNFSRISASCDWWIVNNPLVDALSYYVGIGAFAGLGLGNNTADFDIGGRIPIGLQVWPVRNFELFAEISPLVRVLPGLSVDGALRLGFRINF